MPNWCSNNVTIEATDSELLKRLQDALDDEKDLFNQFVPQPEFEGDQDWYMWNIENWGTKWDAKPYNGFHWEGNTVAFSLETAWSPPITTPSPRIPRWCSPTATWSSPTSSPSPPTGTSCSRTRCPWSSGSKSPRRWPR